MKKQDLMTRKLTEDRNLDDLWNTDNGILGWSVGHVELNIRSFRAGVTIYAER